MSVRCCQRVTSAVVFIFTEMGFFAINYLDDLGSAEEEKALEAYTKLQLLADFGLKEALEKSVSPSTVMVFLGIEVNTLLFTLTIPQEKWAQIQQLLKSWQVKQTASKKETQSLAGSLNFACRCVHSGRVYLSRILNFLRSLPDIGRAKITPETRRDIDWWVEFAPSFNGISLMLENEWAEVDSLLSSDSCLTGGSIRTGGLFPLEIPRRIT